MSNPISFTWPELTSALIKGEDLSVAQIEWAMNEVMQGSAPPIALAGFLVAMQVKGVSVPELAALAGTMLKHSKTIDAPAGAVDIVGTGGDGAHTVNISTMSSLVVAGTGVPVVKHGNRAVSSKSGSADVLEALGVRLDLPVEGVQQCLNEAGITFCFAQTFHPSMRFAAEARQGLKLPTVFNVLGPLTNPARVNAHAIGVAFEDLAPTIAGVFAKRGSSTLVFRGEDGLDELSIATRSRVWEVHEGAIKKHTVSPADLGLKAAPLDSLRGGDVEFNAQVARDFLAGKPGPVRDAVVLNAAAGLVAARALAGADASRGLIDRLSEAARDAEESIDSGAAQQVLNRWVEAARSA